VLVELLAERRGVTRIVHGPLLAFRMSLRDLGWMKGKNFVVHHRFAEPAARLPAAVTECLRLEVSAGEEVGDDGHGDDHEPVDERQSDADHR
jgi:hypothetical protein